MRIVFMGTPMAAVPSLLRCIFDGHEVAAIYTQPDRRSGRGQKIVYSPVKETALEQGLPILQPTKLRIPESINTFRDLAADVAVVVAYGRILPVEYLNTFHYGAVNVHFSLLPKYRGAAPVNWAIAEGEEKTGVTTMKMDEGLDTGDILLQRPTSIGPHETSIELTSRLADMGADLLSETLADLSAIKPKKQDETLASYAPILRKEDGAIDWSQPADRISRRVRGFQPFPGSFTYYEGSRLVIWKALEIEAHPDLPGSPGEVVSIEKDLIVVRCGNNTALAIQETQPEGKRRMSVSDFLNGTKLDAGARLGPNEDEN
jgi:methionyl-tRNA formyltransferase